MTTTAIFVNGTSVTVSGTKDAPASHHFFNEGWVSGDVLIDWGLRAELLLHGKPQGAPTVYLLEGSHSKLRGKDIGRLTIATVEHIPTGVSKEVER